MQFIRFILLSCALGFVGTVNAEDDGGIITNQADIVDIVAAINVGEIQAVNVALKKAQNPEVKKFAQQMHKEHDNLNKEIMNLDIKLGIPDDRSARSIMIKEKNEFTMGRLKDKTGAEFDKTYIQDQVMMHKLALETLEHSLIPSAKDAKLKTALQKARESVIKHLEHAQSIEKQLNK
jgi:putative membrane protein